MMSLHLPFLLRLAWGPVSFYVHFPSSFMFLPSSLWVDQKRKKMSRDNYHVHLAGEAKYVSFFFLDGPHGSRCAMTINNSLEVLFLLFFVMLEALPLSCLFKWPCGSRACANQITGSDSSGKLGLLLLDLFPCSRKHVFHGIALIFRQFFLQITVWE